MAEQTYQEALQEMYGSTTIPKVKTGIDSNADQVDLQERSQAAQTYEEELQEMYSTSPTTKKRETAFDGNVSTTDKLNQKDLLQPSRVNTIREYMIAKNGIDYEDIDDETLIDDFVENMRWFNTNSISTAGEVIFMNRANEREKQVAGEAYKLYDQLGSFWTNDGLYGKAEGIFDYIYAAAADPSNYIGLATGGLAKAGTISIAQGGKLAIKKAAADAAKRATKRGSTKKAVIKAQKEAEEAVTKIIQKGEYSGPRAKKLRIEFADNAKKTVVAERQQAAAKLAVAEKTKGAGRNALLATAVTDGAIAYMHDSQIQDVYIEANYQEQYNRTQAWMTTAMGGLIAPAAQLVGRRFKGASGLQDGIDKLDLLARTGPLKDSLPMLNKKTQKKAVKIVRKAYESWAKKVKRGEAEFGTDILPEDVFAEIVLGPLSKPTDPLSPRIGGGLTDIAIEAGVKINKKTPVGDVLTNMVRYLPEEDYMEVSKLIESATAIKLGDLDTMPVELGDLIASSINKLGRSMSVLSQSRRKINDAVVGGNDVLLAATGFDNGKKLDDAINSQPFGYAQNVWKRLLVSSPATTALNLAGFGAFAFGQLAVDLINAGGVAAKAVLTNDKQLMRQAKVYIRVQGQKMRNFADAHTTYEGYMALLDAEPAVKKVLFETIGAGVERTSKQYGIDASKGFVSAIERGVGAANDLTGVRIQDSLTKSQMFMGELDKYIDLKYGRTLDDVLRTGDMKLIDEEVTGQALDTTMRSVFAKDYTKDKGVAAGLAKIVENASATPGIGLILPFGRFMNNVVASSYQFSPLAYLGVAKKIMNKSGTKIQHREAISRATVGTVALVAAARLSESQQDQGLGTFELRQGSAIVDVTNVFPLSYMLAAGKVLNHMAMGKPITSEMRRDLGEQLAVGQIAKDMQFGTDLSSVLDYFNPLGGKDSGGERETMFRSFYNAFTEPGREIVEDEGVFKRAYELTAAPLAGLGADVSESIGKPVGNILAGVFRPLDPINKLVGFLTETDTAKDVRQARGFGKFNQSATKYFDNILEAIGGQTETITGESLRVSSREGELYDPNPLARIFGIKLLPGRTATEKVYSLSGIKGWSKDQRSNMPAYDRIFNETMAPILERRMGKLLNDPRFKAKSITEKRTDVNSVVTNIRTMVRKMVQTQSRGEDYLATIRYKTMGNGNKEQKALAMKHMRDMGVKVGIRDMNYEELRMFNANIQLQKMRAAQ